MAIALKYVNKFCLLFFSPSFPDDVHEVAALISQLREEKKVNKIIKASKLKRN